MGDVGDPDQAQVFAEPAIFAAQALDAATDNDSTRLDIIIFMREKKDHIGVDDVGRDNIDNILRVATIK